MAELDNLDRSLLALLRADGRMPVANLARELGVTRATVTSRMDKLTERGVIVGYTVRLRDEADTGAVHAVSLIEVEGRAIDQVIHRFRGFPEIEALYSTSGDYDLVAETRTSDLAAFDALLGRMRRVDGVLNSRTALLLTSVLR
ncbi:MAG: Lrp/AsnC family transcriptional regulator [Brachybacterium sp.]|nr:Lrp/AsnC family transcriptional regulator [Brachybacterium sp.]